MSTVLDDFSVTEDKGFHLDDKLGRNLCNDRRVLKRISVTCGDVAKPGPGRAVQRQFPAPV